MKNILVVDDSALTRRVLCDIINDDERFCVQDRAADGIEALELLCVKKYDAVVLDVNMPRMGGLDLLKELWTRKIPARILLISSHSEVAAKITFDALEIGALDFVQKPGSVLECRLGEFRENLLNKLAIVVDSKYPVFEKISPEPAAKPEDIPKEIPKEVPKEETPEPKEVQKSKEAPKGEEAEKPKQAEEPKNAPERTNAEKPKDAPKRNNIEKIKTALRNKKIEEPKNMPKQEKTGEPKVIVQEKIPVAKGSKLVAIASSTGGPKALQALIPNLPANLNAPVVIVQHMPEGFTSSLAERLNYLSEMRVKEAAEGDVLEAGVVYIARGGKHLNIMTKSGKAVIHYTDQPNREGVKPCANYMYESLTDSVYDRIVCVIMTGMGADGTKGILNLIKKKKLYVIAQESSTCAVYGMPRSIVEAGVADKTVPLGQIAQEIIMNVGVK